METQLSDFSKDYLNIIIWIAFLPIFLVQDWDNSTLESSETLYDDLYSETSFATTLLVSVYATMLICVVLLFTRIIYIAVVRSFNRPLRPNPSFIISSSDGPTCNDS
uniref:Uncharacterized protein n=1 Tax=Tetranychus urticae TaxID=32264 RepID=T1KV20_TETUR